MEKDILNELYLISEVMEKIAGYQQERHDVCWRIFYLGIFVAFLLIVLIALVAVVSCNSLGLIPGWG